MRRFLFILCALFVLAVVSPRPSDAQDKPDPAAINKKKTLELLEKAADEYRAFFKQPEKTFEYWAAIKFEMDLGKFDLAALHIKRMLGKDQTPGVKFDPPADLDKALISLEEAEGISAFLRLQRVKRWSEHVPFHEEAVKNVDELVERVTSAVKNHLSDKARIKKYIAQLDARTPEERGYAYIQVLRSGDYAVPELIETLRTQFGKSIFSRAREVLVRMGKGPVPIYVEIFKAASKEDANALDFRITMLDLIHEIRDDRVAPYLWHMSAAPQYPEGVRKKAKSVLASLLRTPPDNLPEPREKLTLMAEQYYQHKFPFPEDKKVKIWEWDGQKIQPPVELIPYRAEEYFAERYAREALDIDPSYKPAQIVLLSLMLDRTYRPKIQTIVGEPLPPNLQKLLTSIDTDLILRVMERAMEERQIPIVLPLIKALGERGDSRTIRANPGDQPRGIARALFYADRGARLRSRTRSHHQGSLRCSRPPSSAVQHRRLRFPRPASRPGRPGLRLRLRTNPPRLRPGRHADRHHRRQGPRKIDQEVRRERLGRSGRVRGQVQCRRGVQRSPGRSPAKNDHRQAHRRRAPAVREDRDGPAAQDGPRRDSRLRRDAHARCHQDQSPL
ncbi:MAG: hypothetical protein HYR84_04215, partial [Planctomycetes bacterium]|nr:hypothetical protein [Planctomycetota bacterium]